MRINPRAIRALVLANLRTFLRNPLPSSGLMIILVLLLFGVRALAGFQAPHLKLAVADESHSAVAARILADLRGYTVIQVQEVDAATAASLLKSGGADLAVVIPSGLGDRDAGGKLLPAAVAVSYRAGASAEPGAALVAAAVDDADRQAQGAPQVLRVATRILNADQGLLQVFLPGLLAFNVINAGLILAAGVFAGYRSSGTLRRIQATGIAPADLVLAHAFSNLLLAAAQVLIMLIAAELIFGTTLDLPALLAVTMLGYLVFLAIGLAVSGWIRDPQRAPVVATSIAFPMIFIGLIPSSSFGGVAGWVLGLLPVTMATHALREIVTGSGPSAFGGDLVGLAVWAVVALAAASRVFRWDS